MQHGRQDAECHRLLVGVKVQHLHGRDGADEVLSVVARVKATAAPLVEVEVALWLAESVLCFLPYRHAGQHLVEDVIIAFPRCLNCCESEKEKYKK